MGVRDFLKEKILTITLLLFGIATIEVFLVIYPVGNFIRIYIPIIIFTLYFIGISFEYFTKRKFYLNLLQFLFDYQYYCFLELSVLQLLVLLEFHF